MPDSQPKLLRSKLFWVSLLYFSEGFPLGVFYDVFPVYFRQQGIQLDKIGLLSLLGLAWTLKFLWAPVIEATRRHRYWMAAADIGMGLILLLFAMQAGFGPWVWIAIGTLTVLSATNDIATDGYTIEWLDRQEMGLANGVRIGAYRVGMLAAGVVLILSDLMGWHGAYIAGACIFGISALFCLAAPREQPAQRAADKVSASAELRTLFSEPRWLAALGLLLFALCWPITGALHIEAFVSFKKAWWFKAGVPVLAMLLSGLAASRALNRANAGSGPVNAASGPIFGALVELLARPGIVPVLIFILIFKLADASLGFMVKPFWVDSGFTNKEIGLVSVNIGLGLSILGGIVGGWYTDRVGIYRALWILGLWQAASNLGYALAAAYIPGVPQGHDIAAGYRALMYGASMVESFTGGLGTAAFLAFLMAIVNKQRATTEYAILSSIFAFSRSVAGWAGGIGAQEMGYAKYFFLTFFLAFPAYALLRWAKAMIQQMSTNQGQS